MNAAQHQFVNRVVQSLAESHAALHDTAGMLLPLLFLAGLLGLAALWVWILRGGVSRYLMLESVEARKQLERWLRET